MIRRISSNLESFKSLEFDKGLNIVLADKSEGATDRQSRNGAGKTSLIELVHFLTGSNAGRGNIFCSETLKENTFSINMDVGLEEVLVERTGSTPSKIRVDRQIKDWPVPAKLNKRLEVLELSNTDWRENLGAKWFNLDVAQTEEKFKPSLRSLFSYFVRRDESGGFSDPIQHSYKQQLWDKQVNISYLLGMDWRISQEFQGLREKEKTVKNLRKAVRSGGLGPHFGRAADLRTKLAVATRKVASTRRQLENFEIIPEYRELEAEASEITVQINGLGEENFIDRQLIRELETSYGEEKEPQKTEIARLYQEAGIVLTDLLKRRLNEVERFHHTVIKNRKSHLSAEIVSAKGRIDERETMKARLDVRRSEIMNILKTGGALEQYTAMHEELARLSSDVETLQQQLSTAEDLESTSSDLQINRNRYEQSLRDDIHERRELLNEAIVIFEELSESLYDQAGSLTIDSSATGLCFEIKIDGQRSRGITNMQIFCFDLMLMEICSRRGHTPGFLIHDSHLFDGVDARQIARALEVAADRSKSGRFQYIFTMNSDSLPIGELNDTFDLNQFIVPTRLTDATDDGGLFGIRFTD